MKIIRGVKRQDYFPDNKVLNDYYNKESTGKKQSGEGYERLNGPKLHHYNRRHYPSQPAQKLVNREHQQSRENNQEMSRSYANYANGGHDYSKNSPKNKFG